MRAIKIYIYKNKKSFYKADLFDEFGWCRHFCCTVRNRLFSTRLFLGVILVQQKRKASRLFIYLGVG